MALILVSINCGCSNVVTDVVVMPSHFRLLVRTAFDLQSSDTTVNRFFCTKEIDLQDVKFDRHVRLDQNRSFGTFWDTIKCPD
jgi:hypothetical protein